MNLRDKKKVNTVVLYSTSIDDALSVLRILGPASSAELTVLRGVEGKTVNIDLIGEGDIVVIQRDFPRDPDSYEQIITKCHAANIPVVFDIDDLLFELPDNHPDRISCYYADSLLPMMLAIMEADIVTTASPALLDYFKRFNKNIKLFPNFLDDSMWSLREPSIDQSPSGILTIGYMGGLSHKPDLLAVLPALKKIHQKFPHSIKFHFWGIEPPIELAAFSRLDWCPPKSYAYLDFAKYFQTQSADIMIAPLLNSEFNRCKSWIKYLEYSSLGIPGIYSKVTPYESVIDNGVNGLLASSLIEWEQSLLELIENPNMRKEIALNAQQDIREKWLLSNNAQQLKKIYENAVRKQVVHTHSLPILYATVKTLARQVYENNQIKNKQISENKSQIEVLNEQNSILTEHVDEIEEELLSYVLSTSWQITRPLRKISGKFSKENR